MTDKIFRIVVPILALVFIVPMIVSDSDAVVLKGKVTSLLGNGIEIDIGSEKGVRVGDTGRVYYTVMDNDKERPVYLARFRITELATKSSIAQIEENTVSVHVGLLAEVTAKEGELEVRSEPSGAKVFLDGNEMGETPIVLSDIWSGQYTVRVVKDGYASHEEQVEIKGSDRKAITVPLRRVVEIPVELKAKAGELAIQTDPSGASIYVDGRSVGVSPYEGKALPPGTFRVRLAKEGYESWEKEVAVEIAKRVEILAYLKPIDGSLEILSEPSGAKVSMNGKEIGETPLTVSRVQPGEHVIRIVKEEYASYEERMNVKGTNRTIRASLQRMTGELLVSTEPEDSSIYIDGKAVGTSPFEGKTLSPGKHKVKIVKEGYEVWERDVVVEGGKRVEIFTKLNEKKRELSPAPVPRKSEVPKEKEAKEIPTASKMAALAKKSCEAPAWKVGDRWTYRNKTGDGWIQEVVGFKDDLFILRISGHQELEAFDKKTMNQTFLIGNDGRKVSNVENPFKRLFDFPLSVGKKWSYSTRSKFPVSGQSPADVVLLNEFKVEGVEEVMTSAGTFMAYKIFHKQEVMSSVTKDAGSRDKGWVRYWYSPDAKTWVKREFEKSLFWPGTFQDAELVSYELK